MSADNFWFVTRHPEGGYTYIMGFASDDDYPVVDGERDLLQFATIDQALMAAMRDGWTEYGAQVDPKLEEQTGTASRQEILAVLEGLASEVPMNQDEQGGCVWCGGNGSNGSYGYDGPDFSEHQDDCAWVAGRRLIAVLSGD